MAEKTTAPNQSDEQPERQVDAATEQMIKDLATITAHPEFTNLINEIGAQPAAERLDCAKSLATPEEFSNRGIPTPEGLRITMRYFEAPTASTVHQVKIADQVFRGRDLGLNAKETVCTSVGGPQPDGTTVCVSVGSKKKNIAARI